MEKKNDQNLLLVCVCLCFSTFALLCVKLRASIVSVSMLSGFLLFNSVLVCVCQCNVNDSVLKVLVTMSLLLEFYCCGQTLRPLQLFSFSLGLSQT